MNPLLLTCKQKIHSQVLYNLNLSNVESTEEIHQKLIQMNDVNKIKITGLNKKGKLELFKDALSRLNNVTFNTIQCDLSGNQLTDDQFKEINTALLSKMKCLKSILDVITSEMMVRRPSQNI